jgi:hypothetical protein
VCSFLLSDRKNLRSDRRNLRDLHKVNRDENTLSHSHVDTIIIDNEEEDDFSNALDELEAKLGQDWHTK